MALKSVICVLLNSLTSIINSSLESGVYIHISNALDEPLQSAYRVGHSTETVLLKVQNDILQALGS